jgi:hypothetical protein
MAQPIRCSRAPREGQLCQPTMDLLPRSIHNDLSVGSIVLSPLNDLVGNREGEVATGFDNAGPDARFCGPLGERREYFGIARKQITEQP